MEQITIHAKLVAEQIDGMGYTNYVFEDLNPKDEDFRYIMCVRFPNWEQKSIEIDEIGYLPIDKQGANLLFQLINKRYEKNSTIITTNQPFSKWGEVFSDITLANAILDRLIHHSSIVKITGPSYRLKSKIDMLESKKASYN